MLFTNLWSFSVFQFFPLPHMETSYTSVNIPQRKGNSLGDWIKPYAITVLKPWRNSKIHASFPIWKSWTKIFLRCLSVSGSNPKLKGTFYILWHVFLVRKETFQVPPSRLRKQMQSSVSFGMESLNSVLRADVYIAVLPKDTWTQSERG